MGKIINSTYISLDAAVAQPHTWPTMEGRPGDDRAEQIQTDLLLACDAVLMGRRTYDGFVGTGTYDDVLFPKGPPTQSDLVDSTILNGGMAILTYRVAG
jgi:hypothetical protein